MKEVTISITKKPLFEDVARYTAYEGKKGSEVGNDANFYEKAFTTDADREQLNHYLTEAVSVIVAMLRKFASEIVLPQKDEPLDLSDEFTITLHLPDEYNDAYTASIGEDVRTYIASFIAFKWLSMIDTDRAARYMTQVEDTMKLLRMKVFRKDAPIRTIPEDIVHDDSLDSGDNEDNDNTDDENTEGRQP